MSPLALALAAAGALALVLAGVGGGAYAWMRRRDQGLERRLRWAAAPLAGFAGRERVEREESVFRPAEERPRFAWIQARVRARYPLLDAARALPVAGAMGCAGAGAMVFAMWFLKVPAGWWTAPITGLAGVGTAWYALRWLQARREVEFIRQFPEIVDQIVRVAGAGVPALEALATVADDAPQPVAPILREVRDGLLAGLDTDTTLRLACERVRIAEFTLFAAVIRLQRRTGGGISAAFRNLSETLRERHKIALKAQASTAQSRLTLLVLSAMPVIVLVGQSFISPQSVDILFNTDSGTTLLRWGVGLTVVGLLVARGLAARAAR